LTATTTSSLLGGPWGPIGLVGPIGAVESNGVSTGLYYCNTTGLEGLSVLSAYAVDAAVALDLHSRFGSICGPLMDDPTPI